MKLGSRLPRDPIFTVASRPRNGHRSSCQILREGYFLAQKAAQENPTPKPARSAPPCRQSLEVRREL